MRRLILIVAVVLVAGLALSGCDDAQRSTTPKVIDITFDGDDVTPNGERIDVSVDQPIVLKVTADRAGTIHVHSDPASQFDYRAGKTTIKFAIDEQGIVEVESHALNKQIISLEVR